MKQARVENQRKLTGALIMLAIGILGLGACGVQNQGLVTHDPLPEQAMEQTPTPLPQASETAAGDIEPGTTDSIAYQPIWGSFAPPSMDPATPIPPPMSGLDLPDEVLVWVLLGSDTEPPFTGRLQAIHLLLIHPRLSKASLVSLPGDLYVYIPGYTMQRLNTAYALGGIKTLRETLAYNFGLTPSRFVLAHPGDFQWLVDDIDSIDVTLFYPMPRACGGIPAGRVKMDGALALCYASYREGMDEVSRMQRQQQLLRLIFRKFTHESYLVRLPVLYASYEGWVKTDLSLTELMGYIPLALRLADPDRIGYYMIGRDAYSIWEVPGHSQAKIFLPDIDRVRAVLQQAIDDVIVPAPLTNQVQTLEAQLTAQYEATLTLQPTATPTPTPSRTGSPAPESTTYGETPSPTLTQSGYPYP